MNLLHLQYFYVVAKERGYTKASEVLHVSQPAVSRMVKLLEEDFGFELFERVGRNIQLTKQGQQVFESCRRIFGEVDDLKSTLGQIKGECQGPLLIGAAEPIASHLLPKSLAGFLTQYPQVYPQIFSGPASSMFEKILSGDLEFGLFFHTPDLPERLEAKPIQKVRFQLVVRKDLRRDKKTFRSFIGSREIDDTRTRRFPTIERMRKDDPEVKITISSNNLTAHKEMVLAGLGVSILPDFLVQDDLNKGRLVDLYPSEKFEFQLKLITRKSGFLSLNARTFLSMELGAPRGA